MTSEECNEIWELMQMGETIARIYGLGFGEQPTVWPKAEQGWLADAMQDGKWRRAMEILRSEHDSIRSVQIMAPITLSTLRKFAANKTEPHQADDKALYLEAAELVERLMAIAFGDQPRGEKRAAK